MQKYSINAQKVRQSVRLVATLFVLLTVLFPNVTADVYISLLMEPCTTVTTPPVILEAGIAGNSIIYTNGTSAKASVAASAPIPTYYPNGYNVLTGTYVSGSVPASVQTVDTDYLIARSSGTAPSTTGYNPSDYILLGSTTNVSGTTSDLQSNNDIYMTFRSYATQTSAQTVFAHQETINIGGTNYYQLKTSASEAAGTTLSASMGSTGRQLLGKFVYPFTGVSSIPTSTWTMYYRAWRDTGPSITFDAVSSGDDGSGSTSVSWSHTTGSGSNRIMIVGVTIRTSTGSVSSITYGFQSLTFIRADTHPSTTLRSELWYLIAPASGTATVTVTLSEILKAIGGSVTYTGVAQTSPLDVNDGGTGASNSPSKSVTVNTANSLLLGHLAVRGSTATVSAEGSGQTMRWDRVVADRGHGSDKGPLAAGSQMVSWTLSASVDWTVSVVAFKPATPVGHSDVDILIRQSDGTIRTTIATNAANSSDLTSTQKTLSGTYTWASYTVINQTDYLEIDYYVEVTTTASGISAYLRIDDNTLPIADQTRTTNISLPSEFTSEVEFTGSSNTESAWSQLVWTIDSSFTTTSVTTTFQLYNYQIGNYSTSGDGYMTDTIGTIDVTKTQTIVTNPTHFRNATGYWKIKVKGVKTTTAQFDFKADWIEFKTTHFNEYTASTEFTFSNMTKNTPTQLNFTIVSQYNIANVNVTIQVWNYSFPSAYVTSGQGYLTYISSDSNETKTLSINTNPQIYTSSGNARIKITCVKTTTTQYQQEINQVKLLYSYSSSPTYNYVLKVVNNVTDSWKIRLKAYSQSNIGRLNNCTIYFHNASDGFSGQVYIVNGNYTQQTGSWYDLPAKPAERYIAVTLQANNSEVSYINVYLEILIPDKTTYARYILTFEFT